MLASPLVLGYVSGLHGKTIVSVANVRMERGNIIIFVVRFSPSVRFRSGVMLSHGIINRSIVRVRVSVIVGIHVRLAHAKAIVSVVNVRVFFSTGSHVIVYGLALGLC